MSGLTYPTAVIATNGYYVDRERLIQIGREENNTLLQYLNKSDTILEFGSGIGKNLIALSDFINVGYGIDIKPHYCRIARKLAERFGIKNLLFYHNDGSSFSNLPKFDIVYENGVFERIPKNLVAKYVGALKENFLADRGEMILYFLRENAKRIGFTDRLGGSAYYYWTKDEIINMITGLGLKEIDLQTWPMAYVYILENWVFSS
jgi:SAM-dependent methyltransferase